MAVWTQREQQKTELLQEE
jgi:hypothetical protein